MSFPSNCIYVYVYIYLYFHLTSRLQLYHTRNIGGQFMATKISEIYTLLLHRNHADATVLAYPSFGHGRSETLLYSTPLHFQTKQISVSEAMHADSSIVIVVFVDHQTQSKIQALCEHTIHHFNGRICESVRGYRCRE